MVLVQCLLHVEGNLSGNVHPEIPCHVIIDNYYSYKSKNFNYLMVK